MIKKLFTILLLSFIVYPVFGQTIKIFGKVLDKEKQPMEQITIVSKRINSSQATSTDITGFYSLNVDTKDSIHLVFSHIGFQNVECIMPNPEKDIELDIVMHETSTELGAITISGKNYTRTHIMTTEHWQNRRAFLLDTSIESVINTYAGVSSTNELSSQYQVRGGNFDENIVYVNGIEIYRPLLIRSAQQEGLSFINPNMVADVNFSAGGYGAEYGDKIASVLDIVYKRPEKFEASIGGSLMGGNVYIGNSNERFSQMTSVRYKTTRALLNTTDTEAEYDPSFLDVQTYITYNITSKWSTSFLGNYSRNKYQFTPQTRETSFGTLAEMRQFKVYFNGWENDKFLTYLGAFSINGKLNDKIDLGFTTSVHSSDEQEYYDITGDYRLEELIPDENGKNIGNGNGGLLGVGSYHEHARNKLKSDVVNIMHSGSFRSEANLLKWGLIYRHEKINDKIKEWEMRDSAGYSIPNNGKIVSVYSNLRSNNQINSDRYSLYIQDRYTLENSWGTMILNAGIRGSYWSFNKETLFSPRTSLILIPQYNENITIRLSVGAYYQAPFYKEYQRIVETDRTNTVVPNKDIKSQKALHYVLGSDYYFKLGNNQPFKITGEIYYKKLSDIIPYTVNNVKIRYSGENEGNGYIAGLDLRLYGDFVPGANSWISFSLMKTSQDINGKKVPLPTDQLYNFSIYFQDYFPGYERLRMNLRGSLTQGLPVSAPHKGYEDGYFRMPTYKRIDLGFVWEVLGKEDKERNRSSFFKAFKNIWLGLDVFNIFDIKNTNSYYWVTDVYNYQYAVPNYLTGRQLNIKLVADF